MSRHRQAEERGRHPRSPFDRAARRRAGQDAAHRDVRLRGDPPPDLRQRPSLLVTARPEQLSDRSRTDGVRLGDQPVIHRDLSCSAAAAAAGSHRRRAHRRPASSVPAPVCRSPRSAGTGGPRSRYRGCGTPVDPDDVPAGLSLVLAQEVLELLAARSVAKVSKVSAPSRSIVSADPSRLENSRAVASNLAISLRPGEAAACLRQPAAEPWRRLSGGGADLPQPQMHRDDQKLFERYRASRDPACREALVRRHLPLARRLAAGSCTAGSRTTTCSKSPASDCCWRSTATTPVAASRSRPTPSPRSRQLERHYRDTTWSVRLPRRVYELAIGLDYARERLGAELNREPSVAELARAGGVRWKPCSRRSMP